ncbi:hypothetical protein UY3_07280 [Chelonia mydas]|uniref:Uncharacterized protein n=1 Tax=Chelonia mydas TaxID=8469 RepID=M7BIR9_CHEMY|nr:hypothetical protein UY3_07280 [Chelonia mydas]
MGVERKNHDRDSVQAKGSGYAKPTAELGPEMKTAAQVSKAVLHLAAPIDLERRNVASGSCNRLNLRTRQLRTFDMASHVCSPLRAAELQAGSVCAFSIDHLPTQVNGVSKLKSLPDFPLAAVYCFKRDRKEQDNLGVGKRQPGRPSTSLTHFWGTAPLLTSNVHVCTKLPKRSSRPVCKAICKPSLLGESSLSEYHLRTGPCGSPHLLFNSCKNMLMI